jgi:ketosteroid isomerase-like protein
MKKLLIVLALVVFAAGMSFADDKTDAMASVHQFIDGFNKGDIKSALAACADETSIIDEFPPYAWGGSGGCSKWANDFDADAKKNGITDGNVTLGKAKHIDIAGDRAYIVVPATYAFKQNGKPVKEAGASLTVVLQKTDAGWRITAWSWAKN